MRGRLGFRFAGISLLLLCAGVASAGTIDFGTLSHSLVTVYGSTSDMLLNGYPGYAVRLTNNVTQGTDELPPAGAVWSSVPQNVGGGFSVSFEFRMSGGNGYPDPSDPDHPGADGFAFVIQNNPNGYDLVGRGAGGIGYMYIPNGVALEFDTYQNMDYYGDLNGNHVAVNASTFVTGNYLVPNHDCVNGKLGGFGQVDPIDRGCNGNPGMVQTEIGTLLNDGEWWKAQITYSGDFLSLYLNSSPIFSIPFDLDSLVSLDQGTNAYIGFTSGSRNGYQNTDIYFPQVPEPATVLLLSTGLIALGLAGIRRRS